MTVTPQVEGGHIECMHQHSQMMCQPAHLHNFTGIILIWSKIGLRSMPASSIMIYLVDCETDVLSSSSCTIFYYTTIKK